MAGTSVTTFFFLLLASSSLLSANAGKKLGDQQLCATHCQCDVEDRYIRQADCSAALLKEIPFEFPKPVSKLILDDNPIGLILFSSFQDENLENLEEFQCIECEIEIIEENAFKNLNRLKNIDISYNRLNNLSIELFKDLKDLRYLNVENNDKLNCNLLENAFVEELPNVEFRCGNREEMEIIRLKRTITDNVIDDKDSINDKIDVEVSGTDLPIADTGEGDESSNGWGVGTYIVLAILILIISIVCFKFVYLRLRKRCKKARRYSEEEPFDSE